VEDWWVGGARGAWVGRWGIGGRRRTRELRVDFGGGGIVGGMVVGWCAVVCCGVVVCGFFCVGVGVGVGR